MALELGSYLNLKKTPGRIGRAGGKSNMARSAGRKIQYGPIQYGPLGRVENPIGTGGTHFPGK